MPLSIFNETTDSIETQFRMPVPRWMDIYKPSNQEGYQKKK
jgi:hypothetical protein